MEIFLHSDAWITLLTLTFLEIVLGIDNIIFISIIASRLPEKKQKFARVLGLSLALIVRIILLSLISWIVGLTQPLFSAFGIDFSWRDIILFGGGLFLIAKSTTEMHHKVIGKDEEHGKTKSATMRAVITQIVLLDIVFSFDSILTAIGLTDHLLVMILAVIIAMIIMMVYSGAVSNFINKYPTLQVLALSFLIMIGLNLILEAFHLHVPKGYIYFSVLFSLGTEFINIKIRKRKEDKDRAKKEK